MSDVALLANIVALKWGLPPAIAVAAEQALGVAP